MNTLSLYGLKNTAAGWNEIMFTQGLHALQKITKLIKYRRRMKLKTVSNVNKKGYSNLSSLRRGIGANRQRGGFGNFNWLEGEGKQSRLGYHHLNPASGGGREDGGRASDWLW